MPIETETITAGEYPQRITIGSHTLASDLSVAGGGTDIAPGPHDLFDAALATCKASTALWYAKRHQLPLERVSTRVTRDDSQERKGVYKLRVEVTFHGPLTDEQRAVLGRAIAACPIHKLMTTTDVQIEQDAR